MASSPSPPPCPEITRNGNSDDDSKEEGLLMIDLERVRKSLIRQEDSIAFSLIERAKFPSNSSLYKSLQIPGFHGSLIQYIVKETEILHSKVGRYESPEEHAFFPDGLPLPLIPCPPKSPEFLHGAASSININSTIWKFYLEELLPLFTKQGDDAISYACTAVCDLNCLQALSRRIHYGKFVAEVKFRDAPEEYGPAIRAQDRDALMKLLTFEDVEEIVKKRVEKKAMIFSQEVNLNEKDDGDKQQNCKIDPSVLSRLYGEWVMPLTKLVQVEYLLRRLDK
ncbi:hypothetical protein MKW98_024965 [Papaver atlanticum]|uniref:Chorismate mutase n=1 Tax=Papaver atlanticum TaxID=357466 RepID=A0AAD4XPT7_9MAGN|nr:hypothetical protein MKW98_024965 [Papaver atlanticum]